MGGFEERPRFSGTRPPRPGDFLKALYRPQIQTPDPSKDFGMFSKMNEAFLGLHEHLDNLRSNQGRVGYGVQNMMSDLSKAHIDAVMRGDEEEMAYTDKAMDDLLKGLGASMTNKELAETGNRFSRTVHQERGEAELFGKIWPVILGKNNTVPDLISWKVFPGNVQAFLYVFLDVVSEMGKSVTDELYNSDLTTEEELAFFQRYLAVADSITLRLSQERHVPSYVINNGYDRFSGYSKKLRIAYGCIANIRREYNLRRSIQRMIQNAARK